MVDLEVEIHQTATLPVYSCNGQSGIGCPAVLYDSYTTYLSIDLDFERLISMFKV